MINSEALISAAASLADLEERLLAARAEAAGTPAELAAIVALAARLVKDPYRRSRLAGAGVALARRLGDDVAGLRCQAMVVEFRARFGHPSEALPDALETIAGAERAGDPLALAQAHHTVAMCFHLLDCVAEALDHSYAALDCYQACGDRFGEGRVLSVIADLMTDLGESAQAPALYERAHDLFLESGDPSGAAVMLSHLAELQRRAGAPAQALATCRRAIDLCTVAGDPLDAVRAMAAYAEALAETGQPELSEQWLRRAAGRNRRPNGAVASQAYEIDLLLTEARAVHLPGGHLSAARDVLERAAQLADQQGAIRKAAAAESMLAEVLKQVGDVEAAFDHVVRSRTLVEQIAHEAHDRRIRALRVCFDIEHAQREAQRYRAQAHAQAEIIAELQHTKAELAVRMAELERLHDEVFLLSRTDPLTGLANRRLLNERFSELVAAARDGSPLALVIFDIDHFKEINDRYGHETGDLVLVALAELARRHVRPCDVPARLGGDEFVVLMPGVTDDEAAPVCQRLHEAVRGHPWEELAPGLAVTITIGIADGTGCSGAPEILRRADATLYRGKDAGRDTIAR